MENRLEADGFVLIPGIFSPEECAEWIERLGPAENAGRRGLLQQEEVRRFAESERLLALLRPHLPAEPRAVRAIYFNKSEHANWLVPWHQDLSIAVQGQREVPGYGPWSVKEGLPHVQPPASDLERMLTIRLHLDRADETNGALQVLPGSHRQGRLNAAAISEWRERCPAHLCRAEVGDLLLMRPLLLHASSRSEGHRQRRVLHIEYAGFALPQGLQFA